MTLNVQERDELLRILDASPSPRTRAHANELRARYLTDAATAIGVVVDRFDALTDDEILGLGGFVVGVRVWSLKPERTPLADVRLGALTRRQAEAQLERVRLFVREHGPTWSTLEKEAGWIVSAFGPEPEEDRRPHLHLVKEVP